METKPRNVKKPTRVDITLSQALLNISLGIPVLIVLYLFSCNISENKKYEHELKIANKAYSLESLKVVNNKFNDSIIIKNLNEKQNLNDSLTNEKFKNFVLETNNNLKTMIINLNKINSKK